MIVDVHLHGSINNLSNLSVATTHQVAKANHETLVSGISEGVARVARSDRTAPGAPQEMDKVFGQDVPFRSSPRITCKWDQLTPETGERVKNITSMGVSLPVLTLKGQNYSPSIHRSCSLRQALMLLATQLWRKATCAERKEYLVDNRQLKALAKRGYRTSHQPLGGGI